MKTAHGKRLTTHGKLLFLPCAVRRASFKAPGNNKLEIKI